MLRRIAILAAGLTMTASGGLIGVGAASAVSPALHIEPGSGWRAEPISGGCELDVFSPWGTFSSEDGGGGTWSGGGETVRMKWTRGTKGLTFEGTFTPSAHGYLDYEGKFSIYGYVFKGQLAKGTRC